MRAKFTPESINVLRKHFESLLEVTEQISIYTQNQTVVFHAVDALWVCDVFLICQPKCFVEIETSARCVRVNLKALYDFIRAKSDETTMYIYGDKLHCENHKKMFLEHIRENCPLRNVPDVSNMAAFNICANEFSNCILELITSCSTAQFEMHSNAVVNITSMSDMGSTRFSFRKQHKNFVVLNPQPQQTVPLILKYLKIVCSCVIMCHVVYIYLCNYLVIKFTDIEKYIECIFVLRPYHGPQNILVDPVYYETSLRLNA